MDKLYDIYKIAQSLRQSMVASVEAESNIAGKYTSYPYFLRKFQEIRTIVAEQIDISLVDSFDPDRVPNPFDQTWPQQKQIFEMVLSNLNLLISRLEIELDIKRDRIQELREFFQASIRKAVLNEPNKEKDIQDVIETLLIGHGYQKGLDYDREVGRVKIANKEVIPDFIVSKFNMAIEVKFSKDTSQSKKIVDEINADIISYRQKYDHILFIVYDMGSIRDEVEYKQGIVTNDQEISMIIIKH